MIGKLLSLSMEKSLFGYQSQGNFDNHLRPHFVILFTWKKEE